MFETEKRALIELIGEMGQKNRSTEGDCGSDAAGPLWEVEKFAEPVKLNLPGVEDECVNEFMKKIEPIGDSSEINDWLWKISPRGSEQTEKKQCRSSKHERPAQRRLLDCGTGCIGLHA